MNHYLIDNQLIGLEELDAILKENTPLKLSDDARKSIADCRAYLDQFMDDDSKIIYGINTGFGSLCNEVISNEKLSLLQRNLVVSHACGTGEEVPSHIVKRMLILKVLGLAHGHSGVQVQTVERLIYFFNNDILPVVYQQGSLGASGDLAPLAHLCLPLLGEGEVYHQGKKISSKELNATLNLPEITLHSKEGLALLNGTQFMSSYASYAVSKAFQLIRNYTLIAGLSLEGYDGRIQPFGVSVNAIRRQEGQIEIARQFRALLEGSEIVAQEKVHVQDPYSFRCIPQVHGASLDTFNYAKSIVEREINAVTDNPTIFAEENAVVSAGNFHGQPLALIMDFTAIALAELGSISERRVYKLISGTRSLPAFLVKNPGLNSGFMIAQYTCASIVSQNKQLCTPASVDTIDSSNGQEDHVSMGANAATKLYRVIENLFTIQGIELFTAAQAFEFRRPLKSTPAIEKLFTDYRSEVPFLEEDQYMHPLMIKSRDFIQKDLA